MKSLKFFLEIRVIQNIAKETIHLMQNTYIDKLVKNYQINTNLKTSFISLSLNNDIKSFKKKVDLKRIHTYK